MKLLTAAQSRSMDEYAINNLKIPSITLMENAASHLARKAAEIMLPAKQTAAVFCGTGNNGGDGIAAAAFLKQSGMDVRVFLVGDSDRLSHDSQEMKRRYETLEGIVEKFTYSDEIENYVNFCGVIIDAIFGFGLHSDLREDAMNAVAMMNASPAPVVAADIPSGIETDSGRVMGAAVKADATVTFSAAKIAHFTQPGCAYVGELQICDIGIPSSVIAGMDANTFAVSDQEIILPKRERLSHKGDYGKCLIISGSTGYTGAPSMAAKAALRSGAGLVFLAVPEKIHNIIAAKTEEAMPFPLPSDTAGRLTSNASAEILERLSRVDACLIGPGLGQSGDIDAIVADVIRASEIPLVIDADGINSLSRNIDILDEAKCPVIITPHEAEFIRLRGGAAISNRLEDAKAFAQHYKCVLVLKGHRTITALPDGTAYINTTGNPGMATGGSGDVLSGMITALLGQKFPVKDAVVAAVYLHGLSGDMAAEKLGEYSMLPSDILDNLALAIRSCTER